MTSRTLSSGLLTLGMAAMAPSASAQVIIDFNQVNGAPFSPWAMAALGILVALAGLFFIKRKAGYGTFFVVLTTSLLATTVMQEKDSHAVATPTLVPLTTSGAPITQFNLAARMLVPSCAPDAYISDIGYVWVTSGVGNIAITGIHFETGYAALDPNSPPEPTMPSPVPPAPAPVCHVGTQLNGSSSCVVWYQKAGACI